MGIKLFNVADSAGAKIGIVLNSESWYSTGPKTAQLKDKYTPENVGVRLTRSTYF